MRTSLYPAVDELERVRLVRWSAPPPACCGWARSGESRAGRPLWLLSAWTRRPPRPLRRRRPRQRTGGRGLGVAARRPVRPPARLLRTPDLHLAPPVSASTPTVRTSRTDGSAAGGAGSRHDGTSRVLLLGLRSPASAGVPADALPASRSPSRPPWSGYLDELRPVAQLPPCTASNSVAPSTTIPGRYRGPCTPSVDGGFAARPSTATRSMARLAARPARRPALPDGHGQGERDPSGFVAESTWLPSPPPRHLRPGIRDLPGRALGERRPARHRP